MKITPIMNKLNALLNTPDLEHTARIVGAHTRDRKLHPVKMLYSFVATSGGGGGGRMAAVLRDMEARYGVKVDRSSFYKRMAPEFAKFVHHVAEMVAWNYEREAHPALKEKLKAFRDVFAYDSTTIALRRALAKEFSASKTTDRAGVKLHAAASLRTGSLIAQKRTAERVHDARAMDLDGELEDVLLLLDRAYCGHRAFQAIANEGGHFVTRLKKTTNPHVTDPETGEASAQRFDDWLAQGSTPMGQPVDVDVELRIGKVAPGEKATLSARIVGVVRQEPDGRMHYWWYLTNLAREDYEPDVIAAFYKLRWSVELLWKHLKQEFRLADIEALAPHNVQMLIDVAALSYLLSLAVMHATTTETERKKLSVGMWARSFPYTLPKLVAFLDATDRRVKAGLAEEFRGHVLSLGKDPNLKRRLAAEKKRWSGNSAVAAVG